MNTPFSLSDADTGDLWAVIPVKNLRYAKQRLVPVLSPDHRRGFYRAMLVDVLSALSDVRRLAGIVVVTGDAEVRELVEPFASRILHEAVNNGHSAAVNFAASTLVSEGVASLLQVPGDVPLITSTDIDSLIDAHFDAQRPPNGRVPAVTMTPSRDKRGTNAIMCSPPNALAFRFGDDSFLLHTQGAQRLGIVPVVVERAGTGLDIDAPDDLYQFIATPTATRAYRYLFENGLIDALLAQTNAGRHES